MLLLCALIVGSGTMWAEDVTYTFSDKSWKASLANWTSGKDGNGFTANQGLQVTTGTTGANGTSPISFNNVSKVVVRYCTNASKGVGTIKVQVGTGSEKSFSVTKPSGSGTTLKDATFNYTTPETGNVKVTVNCTENSIYIYSVTITNSSSFSVTYDGNGNTDGTVPTDGTAYSSGDEVTVLDNTGSLVKTGYNFGGWNTQSDGQGSNYTAGSKFSITANTTLYAKWTPIPYTVTLGDDGSTLTEISGGAGVTLPSRSNIGDYTFAGWSTTNATTETMDEPEINAAGTYHPTADITLYPVYIRTEGGGAEILAETMSYPSTNWNISSENTYDQGDYTVFGWQGYVESTNTFDLSTLSKVIVTARTYGGKDNEYFRVGTATALWKEGDATSGSTMTEYTLSNGASLTGIAKIRVTSTSGDINDEPPTGVGIQKVEIYISGKTYYTSLPRVSLSETTDNSEMLTALNGKTCTVTLDRTLTAGIWNTFASPVAITNLSIFGTDAKVRQLKESSVSDNVLTITFEDAASIEAGKPYLVKPKYENVVNPTLEDVTITAAAPVSVTTDYVDFVPTLGKTAVTGDVKDILILNTSGTLVHPSEVGNMKGFRGYFLMHDAPAGARAFVINFGEGESTGIQPIRMENGTAPAEGTYDLSGRRIQGQPTQKGVYIQNGKKVVIK